MGAREKVWSLNAECYAWREDSDERPVLKYLTRDPEPGGPAWIQTKKDVRALSNTFLQYIIFVSTSGDLPEVTHAPCTAGSSVAESSYECSLLVLTVRECLDSLRSGCSSVLPSRQGAMALPDSWKEHLAGHCWGERWQTGSQTELGVKCRCALKTPSFMFSSPTWLTWPLTWTVPELCCGRLGRSQATGRWPIFKKEGPGDNSLSSVPGKIMEKFILGVVTIPLERQCSH